MKLRSILIPLVLLGLIFAGPARADQYTLDKAHTTVSFKIRHLFSWVQGTFKNFDGAFVYEEGNPENWQASATIQIASIDTNEPDRDRHLLSKDFFDVEQFPVMTFRSTHVSEHEDGEAKLHGELKLHGVTQAVVLDLESHGVGNDPWGNTRSGFTATTEINRRDFGLNWNEVLETGQLLVGEEVRVTIEVEGLLSE